MSEPTTPPTTNVERTTQNPEHQLRVDPTLNQILQILQQQTSAIAQQQKPSAQTGAAFKSFQAVYPPEFKGTGDWGPDRSQGMA